MIWTTWCRLSPTIILFTLTCQEISSAPESPRLDLIWIIFKQVYYVCSRAQILLTITLYFLQIFYYMTYHNSYIYFFRLMPAVLVVMGLAMTWVPHLGSGPMWDAVVKRERDMCRMNWWQLVILMPNLFPFEHLCLPQAWWVFRSIFNDFKFCCIVGFIRDKLLLVVYPLPRAV